MQHVHIIGIGGIGVSAVARYYKSLGYSVSWSDGADSELIHTLKNEGMTISIGHDAANLPEYTSLVIYSEAIVTKPDLAKEEQLMANPELAKARNLSIRNLSYPEALAEIVNAKQCIAITGSHGKSTTTSMTAWMLAGSSVGGSAIIGTQVPQLWNSNFHYEDSPFITIEACEYKRSFLRYFPFITVITNIDLDHLDYYKDLEDYLSAFQSIVDQTSGYVLISEWDENALKLRIDPLKKMVVGKNGVVYMRAGEINENGIIKAITEEVILPIPSMNLLVPGEHILHDAHLAYTVGRLVWLDDTWICQKLESYSGAWRRSEIVKKTEHGNILMSDYGHHPNELKPTLQAIKEKYPEKHLCVIFQPHQYSRTRELLDDFATAFDSADSLVIPDIYFSRDKQEDVLWMTPERLVSVLQKRYPHTINGWWLENTLHWIQDFDKKHPWNAIILLQGAGNVDELRYSIN